MDETKAIKKHRDLMATDILEQLMRDCSMGVPELASILGVSGSGLRNWLVEKKMPRYIGLAVEALRRRNAKSEVAPINYIVHVTPDKVQAFDLLIKGLALRCQRLSVE